MQAWRRWVLVVIAVLAAWAVCGLGGALVAGAVAAGAVTGARPVAGGGFPPRNLQNRWVKELNALVEKGWKLAKAELVGPGGAVELPAGLLDAPAELIAQSRNLAGEPDFRLRAERDGAVVVFNMPHLWPLKPGRAENAATALNIPVLNRLGALAAAAQEVSAAAGPDQQPGAGPSALVYCHTRSVEGERPHWLLEFFRAHSPAGTRYSTVDINAAEGAQGTHFQADGFAEAFTSRHPKAFDRIYAMDCGGELNDCIFFKRPLNHQRGAELLKRMAGMLAPGGELWVSKLAEPEATAAAARAAGLACEARTEEAAGAQMAVLKITQE